MRPYPSDDLDRETTPARLVGSWLGRDTQEPTEAISLVQGLINLFRNADALRDELVMGASRQTVPLETRMGTVPIRLLASEANEEAAIPRFGEGFVFGEGLQYGQPVRRAGFYFPLSQEFTRIGLLVDHTLRPGRVWFPGQDFTLEADRVLFRENPFDTLEGEPVYEEGEIVDRQITLWAVDAREDERVLQNRFGFVTGFNHASSAAYRQFVNRVWDAWTFGASRDAVQGAVSAIADIPFAAAHETVMEVTSDDRSRLIVTDTGLYRVPFEATPVVTVGDELKPGDPLVSTVEILTVSGYRSVEGLAGLSLDHGWLEGGFLDSLTFDNREVEVETDSVDGRLFVRFELGGWPGDVDRFWERMHEKGVAADQTLAQLLDPRANPDGEPFAEAMPQTINPLKFLADNVLRNRAVVVRLRPGEFGPEALPLTFLNVIRSIVPPWHGVFIILELELPGDEITMDGPGSDQEAGVTESGLTTLDVAIQTEETVEPEWITESPRFRDLDGICL